MGMTVRELQEFIKDLNPTMEVILQKDAEGNGYSPLCEAAANSFYVPENTWSGEMYNYDWTADEADADEGEWLTMKQQSRPALVLVPTN